MQQRICKNSGLKLSILGLGCWSFGGGDYWGPRDQKDVNDIVSTSFDLGVNYYDTAEIYNDGRSEISLGQALKGIPRDKVIIGSKISPINCRPAAMVKHCEASLQRLQTEYLDIYMIHWPINSRAMQAYSGDEEIIKNPPPIEDVCEALQKLKQSGKIRHFGISNFGRPLMQEFPSINEIAVNQLPYSLICRAIEIDALGFCEDHGIGVISYMALMQGILADKYPSFDDIPPNRLRTRHFASHRSEACRHGEPGFETETRQALAGIRRIGKEAGISMADLAFKWSVANPLITCTLFGTSRAQQVEANIKAIEKPLAPDIITALNKVTEPLKEALGNHIDLFESAENDRTK